MKIEVCPNLKKDPMLFYTRKLIKTLIDHKDTVWVPDEIEAEFDGVQRGFCPSPDMLIVLGGDGSIMKAARRGAAIGTPVLGINLGRVGYLAQLPPDDEEGLLSVLEGKYNVEKRMILEINTVRNGVLQDESKVAINDVVLYHGAVSSLLEYEVLCDGSSLGVYRSDGLIISTPTGSTAYSLSAGGPVLAPNLKGICLTLLCPHSLTARPIIVPDDSKIEIKYVSPSNVPSHVALDGNEEAPINCGDSIIVKRSGLTADFISVDVKKEKSFYDILREKMSDV